MDTATKTGIDTAKTASKRVAQETAETTGDLIGNKIADKITSAGKSKSKEKEDKINEREEIYIRPEKRKQIINDLRFFRHYIKMEYQEIINLLNTTFEMYLDLLLKNELKFMINLIKYIAKANKQTRFKTSMLQSDSCDYSDAYIIVKGTITVADPNDEVYDKKLALKNNAPFISYISKINNTLIVNVEELDIVMPMYNLIEYSKNYSKTLRSLWNYYRDKPNSGLGGDDNNINYSIKNSKPFDYKTRITGKLENDVVTKDVEIAVPLKYLSNF